MTRWGTDLLSVSVDTIDLAVGTRASYADLAVQVTLQCRQGRFENLLPYRGQGSEPYLVKLAPCIGHVDPDRPVLFGVRTFDTAVIPLEITAAWSCCGDPMELVIVCRPIDADYPLWLMLSYGECLK